MQTPLHVRQQFREQLGTLMSAGDHRQKTAFDVADAASEALLVWEYQKLQQLQSGYEDAKEVAFQKAHDVVEHRLTQLENATQKLPKPLRKLAEKAQQSAEKHVYQSLEWMESQEEQTSQALFQRLNESTHKHRKRTQSFLGNMRKKVEGRYQRWTSQVQQELALKLPVSEEEHLAAAQDITPHVKRLM